MGVNLAIIGQDRLIGQNGTKEEGYSIMEFSEFCKKFYIERNTIKQIDSQHRFISELFYASGSMFFEKPVIHNDHDKYWTARSLFAGRRGLTDVMRDSFPKEFNEERFVTYFKERISVKSLKRIAQKFGVVTEQVNHVFLLMAICKQLQVIIYDDCDTEDQYHNIVLSEYNNLLQESNINKPDSIIAPKVRIPFPMDNNTINTSHIRLWLPDAELATEEQAEFKSYTPTKSICNFMDSESNIWGISSAKGAGKTYLLQKMRRDMNDYAIPQFHKLSRENEWGTESVRLDPILLEKADLLQLAGLWKVAILCLVINCVESPNKEDFIRKEVVRKRLSNDIVFLLENAESNTRLNEIINGILVDSNWRSSISTCYTILSNLCKQIINNRENKGNPIMIFIDKVDQAVLQPGAEIPDCHDCYKDTKYDNCQEKGKGIKYCLEECRGCCYGCEIYQSARAGEEIRIYGTKYGKRYEHISQWQHLQLALVIAVDTIRLDFEARIQIYYAIRQEAFNAEENLLGANAPKITNHIMVLHYTRGEQERIFNNTIKIQHADYLFNPRLIDSDNYAEAFIGIDKLCHPYVSGKSETIFECIYRHSFDRAREIQHIGDELAVNLEKIRKIESQAKREELVKEIIELTSANLLFTSSASSASGTRTYYSDKQILLRNYWANPDNFKNFIQKIDRNLLFMEDLASICKNINNNPNCNKNCRETNCEHHPFSMLYQIGLLGRASFNANIEKDGVQTFIPSKDITYYRDKAEIFPSDDVLFILHPALTKCIEHNIRGSSIMHFKGFILGNGLKIPRSLHRELLDNKKKMEKKSFEAMYYSKPDTVSH